MVEPRAARHLRPEPRRPTSLGFSTAAMIHYRSALRGGSDVLIEGHVAGTGTSELNTEYYAQYSSTQTDLKATSRTLEQAMDVDVVTHCSEPPLCKAVQQEQQVVATSVPLRTYPPCIERRSLM